MRRQQAMASGGRGDAVVVGAGHNGLVAANLLADAGWEVEVLEATGEAGGSVRTAELTAPGFHCDVFSAFFALGAASPVLRRLELERYGLEWVHAPLVVAHPLGDGRCAVLSRDLAETAASLEAFASGDGAAWERLYGRWRRLRGPVLSGLFSLFPPVKAGLTLATRMPPRELLRFARFALLPVRRLAEEEFRGAGGGLLLGGNALHADIGPEAPGSGFLGFLLCSLGQELGYPAVKGGAGQLPAALVRRLEARGGRVRYHTRVEALEIQDRRAVAVRTADGQVVPVERAVIGAVDAITLYRDLIGEDHLPPSVVDDLRRFQFDNATVKVDWALEGPVPWMAEPARRAGTVHLADSMDDLTMYSAQLACGLIPAKPLIVVGQMTTTDPTRSPAGTETLWAYAHVPQTVRGDAGGELTGAWTDTEVQRFADRIEARIEAKAPGFRDRIRARHVMGPPKMQELNPSLVHGALNVGTAQLYQQLIFRPIPGLGRPTTPIRNVYLASGSAHPGGGVHGAPGANAATLAIRRARRRRAGPADGRGRQMNLTTPFKYRVDP
jgi:phytoene dehydrogenase-like protein